MTARDEYPRPRLVRERWMSLNGAWRFAFDDGDRGVDDSWYSVEAAGLAVGSDPFPLTIEVPFCFQAELSGIGQKGRHDVVWYARTFEPPPLATDEVLLLHFGAVDYRATVWVNGLQVVTHEGGHTPFSADISHALTTDGTDVVVVRAEDPLDDLEMPRGKQYWIEEAKPGDSGIFYTPTTGIWQSVWLEPVPSRRIGDVQLTPDLDAAEVLLEAQLVGEIRDAALRVRVALDGHVLTDDRIDVSSSLVRRRLSVLAPAHLVGAEITRSQGIATWSPDDPRLYDVVVDLIGPDGTVRDSLQTYVGMRRIHVRDGRVYLNGKRLYQQLVLDQGYFPGGLLTAGTDEELRRDIELAKELGFNGARKHQKVEDPRWLYWADKLGFLVWSEMPSAYRFSPVMVERVASEWMSVVARDRSHPCIVTWVPMNESWGVPQLSSAPEQRALLLALYHLTRALDQSRPVVSNDGWEHAVTDICAVHDYRDAQALHADYGSRESVRLAEPAGHPLYSSGFAMGTEPIILTEFGGVAAEEHPDSWGYHTAHDLEHFAATVHGLVEAVGLSRVVEGFCYTQLTDVEQEANGLLTFDRQHKLDPIAFRCVVQRTGAVPEASANPPTADRKQGSE